jgi:hypothetical protein
MMILVAAVCLLVGVTSAWAQDPCEALDDGTGTVALPVSASTALDCFYQDPGSFHKIINGLNGGDAILALPAHKNFQCQEIPGSCASPGGNLGGEREIFSSTVEFQLIGTGSLSGFQRTISVPADCETHTGPRNPGDPIQDFATDMYRLQGQITGDPDFALLRVTAGTAFGLPSPGRTTLYNQNNGTFRVESHFDINYTIEFQGAPGGILEGLGGITQGTTRIALTGGEKDPCD